MAADEIYANIAKSNTNIILLVQLTYEYIKNLYKNPHSLRQVRQIAHILKRAKN